MRGKEVEISKVTFDKFIKGEQKAIENVYLKFKNLMYFVIASYVAKNQALDYLRKQREIPSSDIIDEMYGEEDKTNALLSTFEPLLSNKETIVTYLKIGFSYTWNEIVEETGISESTARRLYESAKEKLRKELR